MRRSSKVGLSTFVLLLVALGSIAAPSDAEASSAAHEYELEVAGQTVLLHEGVSRTFPMQPVPGLAPDLITPNDVYEGDYGILTVTGEDGQFVYSIEMTVPATGFLGAFSVTDLTSGLSGGTTAVSSFEGTIPTSNLRGHRYAGSLAGTAFFLATPVATVVPNYTTFTN